MVSVFEMSRFRRLALLDLSDLATLVGGSALLVSPFLQWVTDGAGNSLSGGEMIDAVAALGTNLPGLSGARLAVLFYLLPAVGAMQWVATGLDRFRRTVAGFAVVLSIIVFLAFYRLVGIDSLGRGPWLALTGATVGFCAVFLRFATPVGSNQR